MHSSTTESVDKYGLNERQIQEKPRGRVGHLRKFWWAYSIGGIALGLTVLLPL